MAATAGRFRLVSSASSTMRRRSSADGTTPIGTTRSARPPAAFREEGGFTERMSRARLETRDAQTAAQGAPSCPKCGKPMRKIIARKGRNAGNPFWSCTGYPDCDGTRKFET